MFEQRPLYLEYRDRLGVLTRRTVRLERIIMDRSETLLTCFDVDKQSERQFKLDRIEGAMVIDVASASADAPTPTASRSTDRPVDSSSRTRAGARAR